MSHDHDHSEEELAMALHIQKMNAHISTLRTCERLARLALMRLLADGESVVIELNTEDDVEKITLTEGSDELAKAVQLVRRGDRLDVEVVPIE